MHSIIMVLNTLWCEDKQWRGSVMNGTLLLFNKREERNCERNAATHTHCSPGVDVSLSPSAPTPDAWVAEDHIANAQHSGWTDGRTGCCLRAPHRSATTRKEAEGVGQGNRSAVCGVCSGVVPWCSVVDVHCVSPGVRVGGALRCQALSPRTHWFNSGRPLDIQGLHSTAVKLELEVAHATQHATTVRGKNRVV